MRSLFQVFSSTSVRHFLLYCTASLRSSNRRPVASLMLSSHRIRGFPCFLYPSTCPSIMSRSSDLFALQENLAQSRNINDGYVNYWVNMMMWMKFNPLNAELNPIFYLLTLLGAHHFLHLSRIRVKSLTLRQLISYTYGAPILDVSRSHTTTHHIR